MPRRYYLLLTVITLAAAGLRLWRLTEVPPGLHYDLAATALLGNDVAFHGYRPIFISAYTGHEALYYYWLALWFRLAGSSVFTLRLAAALLGVLAIPSAWFAIREALHFEEASHALAALAAACLAFAFFHVTFSRFGFRVIVEPVVQGLALGFLFRGLRRPTGPSLQSQRDRSPSSVVRRLSSFVLRRSSFVLAGFFTGLAAYTYLAARLFPVPLAVLWIGVLIEARGRGLGREYLRRFALFAASALAAFAPLGLYFLRHPGDFLNRAGQVVPRAGEAGLLLTGVRRALEMIFLNGEPYDRFNIPGLPLFGPVLGFFFVAGLLVTVYNVVRPAPSTPTYLHTHTLPFRRSTELMLLAWLPAMLVPTALSVHDVFPSNVRAFGLIPLLFVFPARGLLASYRGLQKLWPGPLIPYAYPLTLVTLVTLALGTFGTARDYFVTWANLPRQRQNNDADLTAIAAYLNGQDLAGASVYVSAIHYRHPTLAYLLRDFGAVRWLTGGTSLALPAQGPALYVFARSAPPPEEWIAGWADHLAAAPLDPDNVPAFRAYRFAAGEAAPLPAFTPLEANFGNAATLTGYRAITQTEALLLDLRWRVENVPEAGDFLPLARLDDAWDQSWTQSGGFSYPSEQWAPGDTLITRVALPLPAGLPPGQYAAKVGLYSAGSDANLPRLGDGGRYAGNRLSLPPLALAGPPASAEDFARANGGLTPPAGGSGLLAPLELLGFAVSNGAPRQGEVVPLSLYWHAAGPIGAGGLSLTLGGQTLYQGQPVMGTYPFGQWSPDQVLIDRYRLKLPADFPPGPAELSVSVDGGGRAVLGTLDVQRVERAYTAPPVAEQTEANLGGLAELYGYSLQARAGEHTTLSLVWRALQPIERSYSVFVHVLGADGHLVTQADAEPRGGSYPTTLWAPGEFVVDDYAFDLPPGTYTLEVGLYLPETGERLEDAVVLPEFSVP